jgi:hypothetical protein
MVVVSPLLQRFLLLLLSLLLLVGWPVARAFDEDVYGEDGWAKFKEGPKWQQQDVVLPAYPRADDLIEVPLSLHDFPFTLWIDSTSLDVGDDRVVRYTGVLRSEAGVDNVFYEGIRCAKKEYQRYAYGSGGEFRPLQRPQWRRIRPVGQDRFRAVLMEGLLCPLPGYDREQQLVDRLKARRRRNF